MAAVAGSKGRLRPATVANQSVQLVALRGVFEGGWSSRQTADQLLSHAKLREVGIDTNMICNLACAYCYLGDRAEEKGTPSLPLLASWLTKRVETGAKLIAFIGKEPLADDRAITLMGSLADLRRSSGQEFRTGLVTNGTLVDRWIDRLEEVDPAYIDISIDGLDDKANALRGGNLAARIMRGVDAVLKSGLRDRFSTASVLTREAAATYPRFVETMFEKGAVTCFASPVLRFAMSNVVSDYALSLDAVWQLGEQLSSIAAGWEGRQVIIDLPYRYTWSLLKSGRISFRDVQEDEYEALYWNPAGSALNVKLNPFPYSFWRAYRVTHDGQAILNMDLAAHPDYRAGAQPFEDVRDDIFQRTMFMGRATLTGFIEAHRCAEETSDFERGLRDQFERQRLLLAEAV